MYHVQQYLCGLLPQPGPPAGAERYEIACRKLVQGLAELGLAPVVTLSFLARDDEGVCCLSTFFRSSVDQSLLENVFRLTRFRDDHHRGEHKFTSSFVAANYDGKRGVSRLTNHSYHQPVHECRFQSFSSRGKSSHELFPTAKQEKRKRNRRVF